MDQKKPIKKITLVDLVKFSEVNEQMIRSALLENREKFHFGDHGDEFFKELMGKVLEKMKISLPSLAILRQTEPTRFMYLLFHEILNASETAKREMSQQFLGSYNVEDDIISTRKSIEANLSSMYRMELTLWNLMEKEQFSQALTIVEAIEIEREKKDNLLELAEILNYKIEILSRLGNEEEFFCTLQKVLKLATSAEVTEIKYDNSAISTALEYLLMKKFTKGIPIQPNYLGIREFSQDQLLFSKIGQEFQELLVKKIVDAIFKDRIIGSSNEFNKFLSSEWPNFVKSFKLMNRFVENIGKPYGLQ